MSSDNVWQQRSNTYWPGTTAMQMRHMPPGLYQYGTTMNGWFLENTSAAYTFPYKIYGHHDHIVDRVEKAWNSLEGNLGVLLNGVKGTGKTITAQLIANWAVNVGVPVLVVHKPIPLADVLSHINQPIVVIFDEFEKTHKEEDHQQALLSALDGMSRNEHKRLFIFTTNEKNVEANLVDRPSRIRYCWEFGRLSDDILEDVLTDLLDPELNAYKASIATYLNTRKVLSLDVAKTVIKEVNIFREDPANFASILNLSEQDARGFVIEMLDSNRVPVRTLTSFFTPQGADMNRLRMALTRSGRTAFIEEVKLRNPLFCDYGMKLYIQFQSETEHHNEWFAHIKVPHHETWLKKFPKVNDATYDDNCWVDVKPDGWRIPAWANLVQKGEKLEGSDLKDYDEWLGSDSVHGTLDHADILIRITPNFETKTYNVGSYHAF